MIDKTPLSERDICTKFITPAVKEAGWDEMTQIREEVSLVYNGPGELAWEATGAIQKNGQRPISLTRLATLDRTICATLRLPLVRATPI